MLLMWSIAYVLRASYFRPAYMILAKWREATCWRRICGAAKWAARAVAWPYCGACCAGCSGSFRPCPSAWWAIPALPFPRCTSLASAGESNAASASAAIPVLRKKPLQVAICMTSGADPVVSCDCYKELCSASVLCAKLISHVATSKRLAA